MGIVEWADSRTSPGGCRHCVDSVSTRVLAVVSIEIGGQARADGGQNEHVTALTRRMGWRTADHREHGLSTTSWGETIQPGHGGTLEFTVGDAACSASCWVTLTATRSSLPKEQTVGHDPYAPPPSRSAGIGHHSRDG